MLDLQRVQVLGLCQIVILEYTLSKFHWKFYYHPLLFLQASACILPATFSQDQWDLVQFDPMVVKLQVKWNSVLVTGKYLSEALIFASTNPQYDSRLFIFHENFQLRIPAGHVVYTNCCFCFVLTFRTILRHNMFCRCCELLKKIYLYVIF